MRGTQADLRRTDSSSTCLLAFWQGWQGDLYESAHSDAQCKLGDAAEVVHPRRRRLTDVTTRRRETAFGDAPERRQQAYSDFESPASSDEATALMSVQDAPPQQRNVKLIGALSNLSIQYNFSAIAIALAFMDNTGGNKSSSEPAAAYPRTEAQAALLKSLVFAGASNRRCRALLRRGRCCAAPASRCH